MGCFHHFTASLWELFAGNLLLLVCSLFYLAWWGVAFRPGNDAHTGAGVLLGGALLTGLAAFTLEVYAVNAMAAASQGVRVRWILLGAVAAYGLLLAITMLVFHRAVTSELLLMVVWAALELSAVVVLTGIGRFGAGRAALMVVLIAAAAAAGLVCYVLYYRLDAAASYRDGFVPLASDALVMAVLLMVQALS